MVLLTQEGSKLNTHGGSGIKSMLVTYPAEIPKTSCMCTNFKAYFVKIQGTRQIHYRFLYIYRAKP
jgi:hypothetical protein